MAKRSRRAKARSNKWSRANILNYIAGGFVAVSMVLGSVFVFGGVGTNSSAANTPTPAPITATATLSSSLIQGPTVTPTP